MAGKKKKKKKKKKLPVFHSVKICSKISPLAL